MSTSFRPAVALTAASLAAVALAGCGATASSPLAAARGGALAAQAAPGQVVVKFKDARARQAVLQKLGLRTVRKIARLDAVVVKAPSPAQAIAELKKDPNVLYAEPNYVARAIGLPSAAPRLAPTVRGDDELLGKLWGMAKIQAPAAWAIATGARAVKVAIVDTGIDYTHAEFGDRVLKGHDFVNDDDDAMDDNAHGTHCAGSAAGGIGNGGVVGVAPDVTLLAVKVLSGEGGGTYDGVASGIVYAADQGAPVISMSLGGSASSDVLEDAVKYAISKGSLVVAAMGNNNSQSPSYPAACPGVMPVGSTDQADQRSYFSNYGEHISVGAPGSDILSTVPGGGYEEFSGTSMATPHVAGLAGLVKSVAPDLDAAGLRKRIEASADDVGAAGFDKYFGHGRINAQRAVTGTRR